MPKSVGGAGRKETRVKGVATIQLSNNGMWVTLDAKDLVWAKGFKWYAHKAGHVWYARTSFPRNLYMHNLIAGKGVDHRNGNGLDNRRMNLRTATKQQNAQNCAGQKNSTSAFRGVSWDASRGCWKAQIKTPEGKNMFIGRYIFEMAAACAYDWKARELFGEFARPNFPQTREVAHANAS